MNSSDQELLHDAIARNAGAVLSLPSAGMLRHHRTRMLVAETDGFWVEAPAGEQSLINAIVAAAQPLGLSLKSAIHKIVFTTRATQFRAAMQINKDLVVDGVMLAWPAEIKTIQRRAVYRVKVTKDSDTSVQMWRISEQHYLRERPQATTRLDIELHDLGVGGVGVRCVLKADAPKPAIDQRLRIQLMHADTQLVLEGRVRYLRPMPNGGTLMGVQFKKLEEGIEGRQAMAALTNIVGKLQRAEIRRHRLTGTRTA